MGFVDDTPRHLLQSWSSEPVELGWHIRRSEQLAKSLTAMTTRTTTMLVPLGWARGFWGRPSSGGQSRWDPEALKQRPDWLPLQPVHGSFPLIQDRCHPQSCKRCWVAAPRLTGMSLRMMSRALHPGYPPVWSPRSWGSSCQCSACIHPYVYLCDDVSLTVWRRSLCLNVQRFFAIAALFGNFQKWCVNKLEATLPKGLIQAWNQSSVYTANWRREEYLVQWSITFFSKVSQPASVVNSISAISTSTKTKVHQQAYTKNNPCFICRPNWQEMQFYDLWEAGQISLFFAGLVSWLNNLYIFICFIHLYVSVCLGGLLILFIVPSVKCLFTFYCLVGRKEHGSRKSKAHQKKYERWLKKKHTLLERQVLPRCDDDPTTDVLTLWDLLEN